MSHSMTIILSCVLLLIISVASCLIMLIMPFIQRKQTPLQLAEEKGFANIARFLKDADIEKKKLRFEQNGGSFRN